MRILIAALDSGFAYSVQTALYASDDHWQISIANNGFQALDMLRSNEYGLLLLHACLPGIDGLSVLKSLLEWRLCCPPRVLLLCEPELKNSIAVDCRAPLYSEPQKACALLRVLAKRPVPMLAAAHMKLYEHAAEALLDSIGMSRRLKGYAYAVNLLGRMAASPMLEAQPVVSLYAMCADTYKTTPAAVERCLRVAVEGVFIHGSLSGIEKHFGATVDPERGKPTNRAFLIQAASRIRLAYSCAETRLPNSIVMHQRPAAPTSV